MRECTVAGPRELPGHSQREVTSTTQRHRSGAVRCRASNEELGVADRPPHPKSKAEDAAPRSRNQEEGVAGGHVDDAETKSWASQTGR